jgi:single-stranded-DNA-specific exonuclease
MLEKKWTPIPADEIKVKELHEQLKVNPIVSQLLVQRGINTFEEARAFFRPLPAHLHDPFLMKDMDKAVQRIIQAIDNDEKILLYGDYDVDGTTCVTLMHTFLSRITGKEKIDYYIPDRYNEGYGVSNAGIDYAKEIGSTLIIAMDCGIQAIDKVEKAKLLGIDFIICDHHLPSAKLPDAVAVLDTKRKDCNYPFKELSGCGVTFKLAQGIAQAQGYTNDTWNDLRK